MSFSSFPIVCLFQFQKGSINTVSLLQQLQQFGKFQFQKGSINTHKIYADFFRNNQISIPKRFD